MSVNRSLDDLRRRVQEDPASIAFAQLAEELRRDGANEEAVAVCRAGLAHHPEYLTARVTLGRALIELDRLDEAFNELTSVLDTAPGNLPAIRALAEVYQRRGLMSEALVHYRRALQLAQHDTDLEHTAGRIQQQVAPAPPPSSPPPRPVPIEDLFDFDALLAQLGPPSKPVKLIGTDPPPPSVPSVVESAPLPGEDQDSFALMERLLREREEQRVQQDREAREAEAERRRMLMARELETWLAAIIADRDAGQPHA